MFHVASFVAVDVFANFAKLENQGKRINIQNDKVKGKIC